MGLLSSRFLATDPDEARRIEEEERLTRLARMGMLPPEAIAGARNAGVPTSGMARIPPSFDAASPPLSPPPPPSPGLGVASAPRSEPRGGFRGLLDGAYGLLDPVLPGDGLLDPMFNGGSQGGGLLSGPADGGRGGKAGFNLLRAADGFLGLGAFPAIDRERQRVHDENLRTEIARIGQNTSLDPAAKFDQMKSAIMRAQSEGADVTGALQGLAAAEARLKQDRYRGTLPASERLEAEIDLPGYMDERRLRTRPQLLSTDSPITMIEPGRFGPNGLPAVTPLSPGVTKPTELTTDKVAARIVQKATTLGLSSLSKDERIVFDRYVNGTDAEGGGSGGIGTDKVLGPILQKRARGETLTAGEIELFDEWKSRGGSDLLASILGLNGGGLGGGDNTTPKGNGTQAMPHRPQSQKDFDALPKGAWFINPSDGQLLQKER